MPVSSRDAKRQASSARSIQARSDSAREHAGGAGTPSWVDLQAGAAIKARGTRDVSTVPSTLSRRSRPRRVASVRAPLSRNGWLRRDHAHFVRCAASSGQLGRALERIASASSGATEWGRPARRVESSLPRTGPDRSLTMSKLSLPLALLLTACVWPLSLAGAQEGWSVEVEPYAWIPTLEGEGSADGSPEADIQIDYPGGLSAALPLAVRLDAPGKS